MSDEQNSRDKIIYEWFMKETHGKSYPPVKPAMREVILEVLGEVAAADGIFSEEERKWIIGFASTCGYPQELLNKFQTYEPGHSSEVKKYFQDVDLPYVQRSRLSIVYYGLRAANADGELHEKEIEAIHALAKQLGVTDDQLQQMRAICDAEDKLREKRAKLLFPEG
ncbi:unnamed protein product [Rotaria sp. Silwood1]|nr:unnamed protein product [Rotaria sp. Silwood1]CAF1647098.1 unnamed protein product [Rotaria sp. Silwood1]CAF3824932.1 unnamed protein product [Rotaria sp. Silwood1]CAF4999596.1 unnamed protein product [Rotaria sp. Silwood1]